MSDNPTSADSGLNDCIGINVADAITKLELDINDGEFIDDPPAVARGMTFSNPHGATTIFIARDDPNFTTFNADRNWDIESFKQATVIGLKHDHAGEQLLLGEIPIPF